MCACNIFVHLNMEFKKKLSCIQVWLLCGAGENEYVEYSTDFFSLLCKGYNVGFIAHSNEVRVSGISAI